MVNVTRHNFLDESNALIQKLPNAAYVGVDLEMTGISVPVTYCKSGQTKKHQPSRDDTPEERYDKVRKVPERYSIVQVGIAVFEENPEFRKYSLSATTCGGSIGSNHCQTEDHETMEIVDSEDDANIDDGNEDDRNGNNRNGGDNDNNANREEENNGNEQQRREQREGAGVVSDGSGRWEQGGEVINGNRFLNSGILGALNVREDEPPEFVVKQKRPNNNITSATREVTLNPSSISFLNGQNMDYNKWLRDGIPYAILDDTEMIERAFHEKYAKKDREEREKKQQLNFRGMGGNDGNDGSKKKRLEPSRPEDIAFIAQTMASLREWIDSAAPAPNVARGEVRDNVANQAVQAPNETSHIDAEEDNNDNDSPTFLHNEERDGIAHLTPQCNGFLRRCLYEAIEFEYPALVLEKAARPNTHTSYHNSQIRVLRLNKAEKKARDRRLKKEDWRKMHNEQIGMTRVFEALSLACKGELEPVGSLDDEYEDFLASAKNETFLMHAAVSAEETAEETADGQCSSSNIHTVTDKLTSSSKPQQRCRRRRIPLIFHNGMMDLLFLLTHFHSHSLPPTLAEAKLLISHYFPLIYDTKVLAAEYSDAEIRADTTALGDLYAKNCLSLIGDGAVPNAPRRHQRPLHHQIRHMRQQQGGNDGDTTILNATIGSLSPPPRALIINNGNGSESTQMHEAAYDAFMTGVVFQCLCRRRLRWEKESDGEMKQQMTIMGETMDMRTAVTNGDVNGNKDMLVRRGGEVGVGSLSFLDEDHPDYEKGFLFGRNKLFLMQTLYTIDLENHGSDTLSRGLNLSTTFVVLGIDSSVYTRDIVRVLMVVRDPENDSGEGGGQVGYEIVWINEKSFMVATKSPGYGTNRVLASTDTHSDDIIQSTLTRHGALIRQALERRFPTQTIVTLEEYYRTGEKGEKNEEVVSQQKKERAHSGQLRRGVTKLVSNVFHAFGVGGRGNRSMGEVGEGSTNCLHVKKRRRIT